MKKKFLTPDIFSISLLLLVLVMIACYSSGGLLARYTSTASGENIVTVARWDGQISGDTLESLEIYAGLEEFDSSEQEEYGITGTDITADEHGYTLSGYGFSVTTTNTETSSTLSVRISVSKDGTEKWPAGMKAALYSVNGSTYTFISENETGIFENIKNLAPQEPFSGDYIVKFKALPSTVAGNYSVTITAALDQVD